MYCVLFIGGLMLKEERGFLASLNAEWCVLYILWFLDREQWSCTNNILGVLERLIRNNRYSTTIYTINHFMYGQHILYVHCGCLCVLKIVWWVIRLFVVCFFVESLMYVYFADTHGSWWNSTDNREHSTNSLVTPAH